MSNSRTPIFTPSPGRLCVIPLEEESRSGLLVVRNPNEKPVMGRVSEMAPCIDEADALFAGPWTLHVDDVILFGSNSGLEIKVDGERRIILREIEVLAKVEWHGQKFCSSCGAILVDGETCVEVTCSAHREVMVVCTWCSTARLDSERDCINPDCASHMPF